MHLVLNLFFIPAVAVEPRNGGGAGRELSCIVRRVKILRTVIIMTTVDD